MAVLNKLFKLKYIERIADSRALAVRLQVSLPQLFELEKRLDEHLKGKIGDITPERLEFVCPECLNARVYFDPERNERVCGDCGTVVEENVEYDESLPFDLSYAPSSDLAFGKSLGGTLNGKALMRVLAKTGTEDLGIRARMIRVLTETVEPPALIEVLKLAYETSRKFHLDHDKLFNHEFGRTVRKAFWLCWNLDLQYSRRALVETCFALTLCKFKKATLKICKALKINYKLLAVLVKFDRFLADLHRQPEVEIPLSLLVY